VGVKECGVIEVNSDVKGIKHLYCRYLIEVN